MLKTSSPAWRIWPDFSASIIAASSTIAPRAVLTRMTPGFIAAIRSRERKPRVSSFSNRCSETTSLSASSFVELDELDARMLLRRPVPGDHLHAAAERDARDFRGDAAEADQAERLAGQLHAVLAQPVAGAHLAVHLGDAARRRPHQRDRAFGDRRVAIALDQMNVDAEFGEFLRVHVAARAGAEKHDVLQPGALSSQSRSAARCDRRSRFRRRRALWAVGPA